MLTPRESKGLEFDHVVVVEPALIEEEGGDSGLRELYVALTRPTKTLTIVHSRPLPAGARRSDVPQGTVTQSRLRRDSATDFARVWPTEAHRPRLGG